jgi:hypothetical protein
VVKRADREITALLDGSEQVKDIELSADLEPASHNYR